MRVDLKAAENRIMGGLKDFQRATVDRVVDLYLSGQKRVLVADEVGLGKTLVAKGVIARTARYHHEELQDPLFKVVYICSNQNIANQNIGKLKISYDNKVENVEDTRLSMQHLKIFTQDYDPDLKDRYIQLIPLTPDTSFAMTSGGGSVSERALMFAILKRIDLFADFTKELEIVCMDTALKGWAWAKPLYEGKVVECDELTGGEYLRTVTEAIKKQIIEKDLLDTITRYCQKVKENNYEKVAGTHSLIYKLRMIFAQVSVDMLNPDLVIMDEFQRFKYLISAEASSEIGILVNRFLKSETTKVLLLSATPYKLYSTMEEIYDTGSDEHYDEFLQVVNFLFDDKNRQSEFREVWSNFSYRLREADFEDISIIEAKTRAEDAMYGGICRTERISAVETGDFIDDSDTKQAISINDKDIFSYIEAEKLYGSIAGSTSVPVEYVKSSPYILSFMRHYKLKKNMEKFFKDNPDKVKVAKKKYLWVDENRIRNYRELEPANSRLERLKEIAFENNAEMLLWIPPSNPYYQPQGVFKNAKCFSKVLVFSAWEMVPRMIAGLVSYEAEIRTVGRLVGRNKDKQNTTYFAPNNKRFPVARLRFNVLNDSPQSMSLFCLLYPSKFLADMYDPFTFLNGGQTIEEIEENLRRKIYLHLDRLSDHNNNTLEGREDERWYYMAPLLLDNREYAQAWLIAGNSLITEGVDEDEERGQKGFNIHLDRLAEYYRNPKSMGLGKMPGDLVDVLVRMSIASPAVCAYRSNGNNSINASQLAKILINQFNRPEATAIVELAYGKKSNDPHWKNTLAYCRDGNIQAMLDEYIHMLVESNGLTNSDKSHENVHSLMVNSMKTHSASYTVDTYKTFSNNVKGGKKKRGVALRTHYAVGFYKGEGEVSKVVVRKESIRNSFNSPFRPFVLATTSIGQEGLDFHFYCRRIMHWNLPSNPIDLEQREGRINRFKCLAIRQNIAKKYEGELQFDNDLWSELFDYAQNDKRNEHSDLIPFWCLPEDQGIKIERIVPMYPFSKDLGRYERLIKILSLYRLTLGQARQEELLEYVLNKDIDSEQLKELFINLSPYYREV